MFKKKKYDMKYRKENYARFLVDLPKKDKEEIDKILKEDGISKATFLKLAIKNYKETRNKN